MHQWVYDRAEGRRRKVKRGTGASDNSDQKVI